MTRIREATRADAGALVELYRAAYDGAADLGFPTSMQRVDRDRIRGWIDPPESTVFVAEAGRGRERQERGRERPKGGRERSERADALDSTAEADVVGAARLLEERTHPYLGRLAVHPHRQGEGLGSALLAHVERRAREAGYDRLQLGTFTGHPFLLSFYRERGYVETGVRESEDRPYDILEMETRFE